MTGVGAGIVNEQDLAAWLRTRYAPSE